MAEAVKVLGVWHCPFNYRVQLALKLKGVPYTFVDEDTWKKSPLFDESPIIPLFKKDTPVIVHGSEPIAAGSLVILEYIDEAYGGDYSILPKDPKEKAYARQLAKFIDEKYVPTCRIACWTHGEEQKKSIEQTLENLSILEKEFSTQLKGKKFFGGDSVGYLDIAAAYFAFWMDIIQRTNKVRVISPEVCPTLIKWSADFLSAEIVKQSLPDGSKIEALYQSHVDAILAKRANGN